MNKLFKIAVSICFLCIAACFVTTFFIQKQPAEVSVIYIPKTQDNTNDFWTTLIDGATMSAQEHNLNLTILSPENEADYEEQNRLIKQAAKLKPDVLVISPISYTESTEILKKVKEEYNIPIVLVDTVISENIEESLISSDNFSAGKAMGKFAQNYIDENSKIAIVSHVPNTSTAIDRENGFREGLGIHEKNITETVYSYSDFDTAYNVTVELLNQYPDLTLIAGLNEYSAVGAGNAVKDLGRSDKVKVMGFDNSISAIKMLEEGIFPCIMIQKPFNMGYLGIETAYKITQGKEVKEYIDSGTELITTEYMYTRKGQQSLFAFLKN